jgi:hypothetical protein
MASDWLAFFCGLLCVYQLLYAEGVTVSVQLVSQLNDVPKLTFMAGQHPLDSEAWPAHFIASGRRHNDIKGKLNG